VRLPAIRPRLVPVALSLLAFVLVACEPTGGAGGQPQAASITVSPSHISFNGTSSASISVTATGRWTLASDSDWLNVSRASGSTGVTTVIVTVAGAASPRSSTRTS